MIVVDTNILIYAFIDGPLTSAAVRLQKMDSDWHVPMLWRHEFLNVLASYGRSRGAEAPRLLSIWRQAAKTMMRTEHSVDMERSLELAIRHRTSAYDAQFIVLAETLGVPCITEDRQLLKTFPRIAVSMSSFSKHV